VITLREAALTRIELQARLPFRYGIATMTHVTHVILRLTFEIDGAMVRGCAAENLAPKWFTKDPAQSLEDEAAAMRQAIGAAVGHAHGVRAPTAFAFWRAMYGAQVEWAAAQRIPPLLAQFGASLVERALLDAVCRAAPTSFAAAVRANTLGLELGELRPTLRGTNPADWLPAKPVPEAFVRHTVGLSDPLEAGEVPAAERLDDGLPQTLVESIQFYGLRHFKIKINGDLARDRARLGTMARIFAAECPDGYAFSVDGNESFLTVAAFSDYARSLLAEPELRRFWLHLTFFEQPWHRDVALSPAIASLVRAWPDRPPIIIDESDAELGSLPRALELGYAGTTHKNCKGVFKSIANACLLAQMRAAGGAGILSGEDLTNVGPIALCQDLTVQAALGITSIERNGHHYFAGLSGFPATLQGHAIECHPDLFTREGTGWPRVAICHGKVALGSVNAAPFGVPGEVNLAGLAVDVLA
jgi:hypothetical protein